jgi:4-coumarate--CoA ligase (photoactive yellow protein activation family)
MTRARDRADASHWWNAPWSLERFLADLIYAEARQLRPGGPFPPRLDPERIALVSCGENGLGFDSLEQLGLAAVFSEALHLHSGGLGDDLLTSPTLAGWLDAAKRALDRSGERVTVRSSGTSGKRRSCTHLTAGLAREAETWAQLLPGRRRIRTAVASHHIYGLLFTLMLPAELGLPVDELRVLSPGGVVATLRSGDLVIGHPVFWSALLCAAPYGWCSDVVGITSGAACTDAVAASLVEAGLTRLLDVYGSSETGGVGWRERTSLGWRDGAGAHELLPWWRRAEDGLLVREDEAPIMPPDRLDWEQSGGFRIGTRRDGAVMVGGLAVDLDRVRHVLLAHPGVADAAVRPMDSAEGMRLKAFVVPQLKAGENLSSLLASLASHVETALSVAERPRAFRFGRELPLTLSGKPANWPAHGSPQEPGA